MALSLDVSPLRDFIAGLAGEATAGQWMWQLGVVGLALALGWFAARALCRRAHPSPRWIIGAGDFRRVAFSVLAWAFVAIGRLVLEGYQAVPLLQIVQTLLAAMVAIRIAAYLLGHALPEGGFLRASIRAIAWIAWIAVVLHITGLLPDVIAALDEIGLSVGKDKQRVTIWLALQAFAALALTLTLAAWISRVTETRVLAAKNVEMSTRVVISKLVRAAAIFLAVLIALPLVGIDITALSIFSGALGVGLGFGLQKIASNYVSGFIVLLDRSLRIGDLITVDGRRGEVTAIEARHTVIKGGDGSESLIPNEKLITESVIHHTYTDTKIALAIPLTIAYESDLERACELLLEAARGQPRVLADPPAAARVKLFRDNGIDLELAVWISDPVAGEGDLRSDIYKAILRSYRAHGIEIPYARRDVRLLATTETLGTHDISMT